MKKRLTINYKSGTQLVQDVKYVHCNDDYILYVRDAMIQSMVTLPTEIPMKNVASFHLESIEG